MNTLNLIYVTRKYSVARDQFANPCYIASNVRVTDVDENCRALISGTVPTFA
jgi:hypothetical protein